MKTKVYDRLLNVVSCIPLIGLFFIPFMPSSFPLQYGGDGMVSRWGSRYEYILYFLIPVVAGWCAYWWLCRQRKLAESPQMRNERFVVSLFIILLLAYNVFMVWSVTKGFQVLQHPTTVNIGLITKFCWAAVGLLIAVNGNNLPKTDFLSAMGFRTPWSEKSETAWMRTQRAVGAFHLIAGVVFAIYAIAALDENTGGVAILLFVFITVAVSYLLSCLASRKPAKP